MDVTRENFDAALKEIDELLPSCDFVAIDEEMTGIRRSSETDPAPGDTCEARYEKMRVVATTFNLIQVGVCLFRKIDGPLGKRWEARPYNFFVFPDENSRSRIHMDVSTAYFHKKHKLDFNKWITEGVPYISAAEARALREQARGAQTAPRHTVPYHTVPCHEQAAQPKNGNDERRRAVPTRADDVEFLRAALAAVASWSAGAEPSAETAPSDIAVSVAARARARAQRTHARR